MRQKKLAAEPFTPAVLDPHCAVTADDFAFKGVNRVKMEGSLRPSISFWQDAMRRLWRDKKAIICMIILVIVIVGSIVVPMISPFTISEQHLEHASLPMFSTVSPGHTHIFGTDDLGRDIWTRVWDGGRTSLIIAFTAVFACLFIGVTYGGISGYCGGAVDNVMMRFLEIVNGIPYLIIVILMMTIMDAGITSMIVAYVTVGWVGMARLVRGQIISLKEQEFVMAAHAMGASGARIIARHLVPNILSVVIINITLAVPSAIFTEAFLSFIGLGVPIPNTSWGVLAQEGVNKMQIYPSELIIPALFISITMLSFNLLGDSLRDAFDPKLRT
ncbi:MAG: ABC transporter permease [Ruthenibacterium sp.]